MSADKLLHLGSGDRDLRPGWINIDSAIKTETRPNGAICLQHDLRNGLPLGDGEFSLIYSSHFFEHLTTDQGVEMMKECFRVLRPGGRFRNALPDARKSIMAYVKNIVFGEDEFHKRMDAVIGDKYLPPLAYRSAIDYINRDARGWSHQCLYDPKKLVTMLTHVGFVDCKEAPFDPSIDVRNEMRRFYSFYVDAVKPQG